MSNGYTVRLPFRLPPTQHVKGGGRYEWELESRRARLEEWGEQTAMIVTGLPSESEARAFFNRLITGFMWAAVELHYGVLLNTKLEEITFLDEPVKPGNPSRIAAGTEAIANDGACIYPDDLKIVFIRVGAPTVYLSIASERFAALVTDGTALPTPTSLWDGPKIRLAFDLFCSSYFQTSADTRFMALISVLESLKEQRKQAEELVGLFDRWKKDLDDTKSAWQRAGKDVALLESVKGRLAELQRQSIRQAIRDLVSGLLDDDGRADEASKFYGLRSQLLHDGRVQGDEIRRNLGPLEELVRDVLRAILLQPAVPNV